MNCAHCCWELRRSALGWAGGPIVLRCVDSCVREVESHGAREK